MPDRAAARPLQLFSVVELPEMLGRSARDELELLSGIEDVPLDSIYYHTHSYFLRHPYIAGAYPNDFASWAAIQVRDRVAAERLAVVDPYDFEDLEALRGELISILDDHLARLESPPRVLYGEPFHFMRSTIVEVPAGIEVRTLREFRDAMAQADPSTVYLHFFEAVHRKGRRRGDFAIWLDEELGLHELAERLARLNPYVAHLEQARRRIVALCDEALGA